MCKCPETAYLALSLTASLKHRLPANTDTMSKFAHVLKLYKNKLSLEVGAETWLEVLSWVSVALLVCQSPDFQETGLPQICFPPKSYFITPSSLFYRCSVGEITLDEQKRKTSGKTLLTKSAICHGADNFITGLTVTLRGRWQGEEMLQEWLNQSEASMRWTADRTFSQSLDSVQGFLLTIK